MTMSSVTASRDLVSHPWARATWIALALVAGLGVFVADLRAVLWVVAFGISGLMCVTNAIRSGRWHCMYTGPIYLGGAVASVLRGLGLISFSWIWIGAVVFVGVLGTLVWERVRHDSASANCC